MSYISADDIEIFYSVNCLKEMVEYQRDLYAFGSGCIHHNRHELNVSKCQHVSYYRTKLKFQSHYKLLNNHVHSCL